jgi:hypothetical protein
LTVCQLRSLSVSQFCLSVSQYVSFAACLSPSLTFDVMISLDYNIKGFGVLVLPPSVPPAVAPILGAVLVLPPSVPPGVPPGVFVLSSPVHSPVLSLEGLP